MKHVIMRKGCLKVFPEMAIYDCWCSVAIILSILRFVYSMLVMMCRGIYKESVNTDRVALFPDSPLVAHIVLTFELSPVLFVCASLKVNTIYATTGESERSHRQG